MLCDYQEASQMPQTSRCISERAYSDGTSLARQMPVVTARFTWHRVCRAWQAHHVAAGRKFLTTTRTPVSSAVVTGASSRNSIIVNQMGSSPTFQSKPLPADVGRHGKSCRNHADASGIVVNPNAAHPAMKRVHGSDQKIRVCIYIYIY